MEERWDPDLQDQFLTSMILSKKQLCNRMKFHSSTSQLAKVVSFQPTWFITI